MPEPAPLFASTALAARVELAECALVRAGAEHGGARRPEEVPFVRDLAGGVAVCAADGSPFNKVAGLGFADTPSPEELDEVEHTFSKRGVALQAEVATLADPGIFQTLCRRGYTLGGFENVLARRLHGFSREEPAVAVEVSTSADAELAEWLDVVVTAFASPDDQGVASHESFPREAIERGVGDLAGAGLVRYLARRGGAIAGGASLRIHDGIAQLCGAATLPAHRRRGVQSTLLNHRLADAAKRGCELAVVTTQPGSKSQQNVQRLGFEMLYARAVLVLDR